MQRPPDFACRCADFHVKIVFINHLFCIGSGIRLFQGRFCGYATFINEASDV